jgi:hypothetical protein
MMIVLEFEKPRRYSLAENIAMLREERLAKLREERYIAAWHRAYTTDENRLVYRKD